MKKTFYLLVSAIIVSLNVKSQELILKGTLLGVEDGTEIRISPHLDNGGADMDDVTSIILKDEKFEFKRKLDRPTKFTLRTMPKIPPDNPLDFEYCTFWAENTSMTIEGTKGEILLCKVVGSSIQNQYEEMIWELASGIKKRQELSEYKTKNSAKLSEKEKKEIATQFELIKTEIEDKRLEFVLQHPNYFFAGEEIVIFINYFAHALEKNQIQEFFNKMPNELRTGIYGNQIAQFLDSNTDYSKIVPLQIGDKPHDFTLPDSNSVDITFSTIKGKIILLDFWASGCSPCRKEHNNYAALYDTYKEKGFIIVSVSQDQSKKRWLNAMNKDKMTWVSLWDADSKISRIDYLVTMLPTNFLINEQGLIIAKNIRGEELEKELDKQFEKQE